MSFRPETIHTDTWPAVYAVLAGAMLRASYTPHELIDDLLSGRAQLWVLREGGDPIAAAVSELEATADGLFVNGRLLAGQGMAGWLDDALHCVESHARRVNAKGIRVTGRNGWERVLEGRGWKRRAVVMELAFEPEGVA